MIVIALWVPTTAVYAEHEEYAVKAAFIEKFLHFVDWPDSGASRPTVDTISLCVIGHNPFGRKLDQLAYLTSIERYSMTTRYLNKADDVDNCDVLFISRSESSRLSSILAKVGASPILTFSDSSGFARLGVIVNFYVKKGRVGFEINRAAAEKAGFSISSRVLRLAKIVDNER